MRKLAFKASKSGGVGAGRTAKVAAGSVIGETAGCAATIAVTAKAGAGVPDAVFTKCCSSCVWQPVSEGWPWWQQPRGAWCAAIAIRTCGQVRQFPRNRAATTNATMNDVETFLFTFSILS